MGDWVGSSGVKLTGGMFCSVVLSMFPSSGSPKPLVGVAHAFLHWHHCFKFALYSYTMNGLVGMASSDARVGQGYLEDVCCSFRYQEASKKSQFLAINVQCWNERSCSSQEHYVSLFQTTSSDSKIKGCHYKCTLVYYHNAGPQNGCGMDVPWITARS